MLRFRLDKVIVNRLGPSHPSQLLHGLFGQHKPGYEHNPDRWHYTFQRHYRVAWAVEVLQVVPLERSVPVLWLLNIDFDRRQLNH